jgi:hypothetical protein
MRMVRRRYRFAMPAVSRMATAGVIGDTRRERYEADIVWFPF